MAQNLTVSLREDEQKMIDDIRTAMRDDGIDASRADVIRRSVHRLHEDLDAGQLEIGGGS